MKNLNFILLFVAVIYTNMALCQKRIYIDEKGDTINKRDFEKKWRNKELGLIRWDSIGEEKNRICLLKKDLYQKGQLNYIEIKKELELIINSRVKDSTTILLKYSYKDDLCNSKSDNKMSKGEIAKKKAFLEPIKLHLDSQNILLIYLFEKGIILKNKPDKSTEYFYSDKNNFFGSALFTNKTLCGSYALIKPNGQVLVRNGENRADYMARHLRRSIWLQFFPENPESQKD